MTSDEPLPDRCGAQCRGGGYCENYPKGDSDRCRMHGADAGAPEGNDNGATHGAWSESFVTNFLRDDEIERVKQAEDLLGEQETAQHVARTAASISLEQFRRSGDERFLRRYESICDTFGIAPDDDDGDTVDVNVEVDTLNADEKAQLNELFEREVQE